MFFDIPVSETRCGNFVFNFNGLQGVITLDVTASSAVRPCLVHMLSGPGSMQVEKCLKKLVTNATLFL